MKTAVMAAVMHATSACPRIPLPRCPSRSGSLKIPAARMIGVASRKAKRAESLWSRPRPRPAPIVIPSRLIPATSAADWAVPITNASGYSSVSSSRPPSGLAPSRIASSRTSALRRKRSASEQQQAVDHQEDGRDFGLGGQRPQLVLEDQAEDAGGDARDDDQPRQPLVGGARAARAQRVEERAHDLDPVAAVVEQQAEGAADVEHHHERQPEGLVLGLRVHEFVPAEQGREQDGVSEARDREQLGDALQDPQHHGLEVGERRAHDGRGERRGRGERHRRAAY